MNLKRDYDVKLSYASDDSRTVFFVGDVEETLVGYIIERLFLLSEQDSKQPIKLIVNTNGGSVDEMFAIYDAMKIVEAPVYTLGLGKIMSAGVLILAAGEKGHRQIGLNARVMYHLGVEENYGTVPEQRAALDEFERQERQCDMCLAKECGVSVEKIEEMHQDRVDCYMTPEQALDLGVVDFILSS